VVEDPAAARGHHEAAQHMPNASCVRAATAGAPHTAALLSKIWQPLWSAPDPNSALLPELFEKHGDMDLYERVIRLFP